MKRVVLIGITGILLFTGIILLGCGDDDNGGGKDETGPVISNITVDNLTASSCVIRWTTDEKADSGVKYGGTTALGRNEHNEAYVTSHSISLTGLLAETKYYYRVASLDMNGNVTFAELREFTTLEETNAPPTACFEVTPLSGSTSMIFYFDAGCSTDQEDGSNLQYRWDWENDGSWDTGLSGDATTAHQYDQGNTYTVVLEVKDSGGRIDRATQLVIVTDFSKLVGPMVQIPAGNYVMGDTFTNVSGSSEIRTVYLDTYWIGQYEVTNRDYAAVLNWAKSRGHLENSSGGAYTGGDVYAEGVRIIQIDHQYCMIDYDGTSFTVESVDRESHPVMEVSWFGAVMFCNVLSLGDGKTPSYDMVTWECDFSADGYRLPTEAEWEKAAGYDPEKETYQHKRLYPWGDEWDSANVNCGGLSQTDAVGSSPGDVSYYGCFDMAGNVSEWCYDWWQDDFVGLPDPDRNPAGPDFGVNRVIRGSNWHTCTNSSYYSTRRISYPPMSPNLNIGFRIVSGEPPFIL